MFTTLLIANRGEIACRVAATARLMGIRTIGVYSDADANAKHVMECDVAVHIGGPAPRDSYLHADALMEVARAHGAQAVHPGYGFLSENAEFAQAVTDAGMAFVGPPASAIAAMGSKSAAKALMGDAGVPLVPGYHGDNQAPAFMREQADAIGYPVLIKASAGGGGKGMRVVESSETFEAALASCQREAKSSFGDDRVLIERYLQKPRHIEIQVFADTTGQCVYLFERDCSVQRRHQKVIEEAPAPGMTAERRQAMGEAAVAAARAVGYVGAGTVEFIVEPDGRFYFMEMNTRLQVEHPVTEMITGLDLVEWQLRVAAGEPLPLTQEMLVIDGHAIEARIYAENPDKDFLPSTGTLHYLELPWHQPFGNAPRRIDGGVRQGDVITPFYDPMIAKLIVHGADRDSARKAMIAALLDIQVAGVVTNVGFLVRLMQDEAFAAADLDTGLIERRRDTLLAAAEPADADTLACATAALLMMQASESEEVDPWRAQDGWRVGAGYSRTLTWLEGESERSVRLARSGEDWTVDAGDGPQRLSWRAHDYASAPDIDPASGTGTLHLRITIAGAVFSATVFVHGSVYTVFREKTTAVLTYRDVLEHAGGASSDHGGALTAPMPGKIISLAVAAGDAVTCGQPLVVMEAMKMEHTIAAPADGTVREVFYAVGDQVGDGAELIAMEEG